MEPCTPGLAWTEAPKIQIDVLIHCKLRLKVLSATSVWTHSIFACLAERCLEKARLSCGMLPEASMEAAAEDRTLHAGAGLRVCFKIP